MSGWQATPRTGSGVDVGLWLSAAAAGVVGVLWAAAAASAWLTGRPLPAFTLTGMTAVAHPADPALAWAGHAGPWWLYWPAAVLAAGLAAAAATCCWLMWRPTAQRSGPAAPARAGWANRRQVRRHAGATVVARRGKVVRPSLPRPRPGQAGYLLGSSRGVACWASAEDSLLLLGPPRSGKGIHIVINMIMDAPGPVVTTSTRPDNLAVTYSARAARGPVMVFDPQRLAGDDQTGQGTLAWPLARGCTDPRVALIRAEALVPAASGGGVENGNFWRQQALTVTRCLLHAAALASLQAAEIFHWSHSAGAAKHAVGILASQAEAANGWGRALDAIISAEQRTRDSVWAMVANTFAPLADPGVLTAVTPRPGQQVLDPATFLASQGTIYLLGTSTGAIAAAPFVAALIEDLVHAARTRAGRSPRQRLDPPLLLALDEAANYPLPSLPSLMSEGGGTGITTLTVLQSLAQARDKWGKQAGDAIWDAAIAKIILGGGGNAADLADISRLAGETPVTEWSHTLGGAGGPRSTSASLRYRPVIEPADIRRLHYGSGLLLLRTAPPVLLKLRPWTARRDAGNLATARTAWEQHRGSLGLTQNRPI